MLSARNFISYPTSCDGSSDENLDACSISAATAGGMPAVSTTDLRGSANMEAVKDADLRVLFAARLTSERMLCKSPPGSASVDASRRHVTAAALAAITAVGRQSMCAAVSDD
eukprot:Amastigsp_a679749_60.p7 type:complete len:112 gc:universal Amastigsp_a679749_60:367-32(-)